MIWTRGPVVAHVWGFSERDLVLARAAVLAVARDSGYEVASIEQVPVAPPARGDATALASHCSYGQAWAIYPDARGDTR